MLKNIVRNRDSNLQPFDYETDDPTATPSGLISYEALLTILTVKENVRTVIIHENYRSTRRR
jgi:hypothetical protein